MVVWCCGACRDLQSGQSSLPLSLAGCVFILNYLCMLIRLIPRLHQPNELQVTCLGCCDIRFLQLNLAYGKSVSKTHTCTLGALLCTDTVWLEFNQYTLGSRWRRAAIDRKCHREEGNEAEGFYGGIRKLNTKEEICIWERLWPSETLE